MHIEKISDLIYSKLGLQPFRHKLSIDATKDRGFNSWVKRTKTEELLNQYITIKNHERSKDN